MVFRRVLVCQSKACRKADAASVLSAFQADPVAGVTIEPSGCLGQCGNGAMVLILPEQIWYDRVQAREVSAIVRQHLQAGKPVRALLYHRFHPERSRTNSLE